MATLVAACIAWLSATSLVRAETALAPGAWYTEGVERAEYLQAFVTFHPDGTFEKLLRTLEACRVRAQWIESGNWTFSNNQLQFLTNRVDTRVIDPSDEYYVNTFNVSPLDDSHVQIFDLETRLTWKLTAAKQPFQFPEPPDCVVA